MKRLVFGAIVVIVFVLRKPIFLVMRTLVILAIAIWQERQRNHKD